VLGGFSFSPPSKKSDRVTADELWAGTVCETESQLTALLSQALAAAAPTSVPSSPSNPLNLTNSLTAPALEARPPLATCIACADALHRNRLPTSLALRSFRSSSLQPSPRYHVRMRVKPSLCDRPQFSRKSKMGSASSCRLPLHALASAFLLESPARMVGLLFYVHRLIGLGHQLLYGRLFRDRRNVMREANTE